jgi:hypothetical protein
MPRISWKRSEIDFLIENYEHMTTEELYDALDNRSKKSINRKLEKLREEGKIGHRSKETIRRAYDQRGKFGGTPGVSKPSNRKRNRLLPVDTYDYEEV